MNIGQLDRKVVIQAAEMAQDATGEEIESWVNYAFLYAKKARKSANEGVNSEQMVATRVETYQTRYRAGVTEQMRLVDSGLVYNIRAISEIGRKGGLEITAETTGQIAVPNPPTDGIIDNGADTFNFTPAKY